MGLDVVADVGVANTFWVGLVPVGLYVPHDVRDHV